MGFVGRHQNVNTLLLNVGGQRMQCSLSDLFICGETKSKGIVRTVGVGCCK